MSQQQISPGQEYSPVQGTGQQQYGQAQQGGQQQYGQQMGLQSQMFQTQNYLPQDVREEVIKVLNLTLADATVLRSQVNFAHWNVKGTEFYGLHELFEDVEEVLEDHIDEIAERITALGGQALGTVGRSAELCRLPIFPGTLVMGMDYVQVLSEHFAIFDAYVHETIETARQVGDEDTVDLLNEVSREVSEKLWFLEAHLQTQPVSSVPVSEQAIQQGQVAGEMGQQFQTQQPQTQQPQTQQPQQFQGPQTQQPQQFQGPQAQQFR